MKKEKDELTVVQFAIVMTILFCLITVFASSCNPQRKMWNLEQKHPELLLQYCASKAITDTVIIPGALQVDTQTVWLRCDTIFKTDTLQWTKWKKVPIYRYSADTFVVSKIDTSGKALLRSENSRIADENNTLQGKLSTWQFWAILGWVLTVSMAVGIGFLIKWK